jgi:hypothetical protein
LVTGKKSQEILIGDQAEASLDIVQMNQSKTIVMKVINVDFQLQLMQDYEKVKIKLPGDKE